MNNTAAGVMYILDLYYMFVYKMLMRQRHGSLYAHRIPVASRHCTWIGNNRRERFILPLILLPLVSLYIFNSISACMLIETLRKHS